MKDNFLVKATEYIEADREENTGLFFTSKDVIYHILKENKGVTYFLPGDYIDW